MNLGIMLEWPYVGRRRFEEMTERFPGMLA